MNGRFRLKFGQGQERCLNGYDNEWESPTDREKRWKASLGRDRDLGKQRHSSNEGDLHCNSLHWGYVEEAIAYSQKGTSVKH